MQLDAPPEATLQQGAAGGAPGFPRGPRTLDDHRFSAHLARFELLLQRTWDMPQRSPPTRGWENCLPAAQRQRQRQPVASTFFSSPCACAALLWPAPPPASLSLLTLHAAHTQSTLFVTCMQTEALSLLLSSLPTPLARPNITNRHPRLIPARLKRLTRPGLTTAPATPACPPTPRPPAGTTVARAHQSTAPTVTSAQLVQNASDESKK